MDILKVMIIYIIILICMLKFKIKIKVNIMLIFIIVNLMINKIIKLNRRSEITITITLFDVANKFKNPIKYSIWSLVRSL